MKKRLALTLAFCLVLLPSLAQNRKLTLEEIEKKAREYQSKSKSLPKGISGVADAIETQPTGRFVSDSAPTLDTNQQRHVVFHMRAANRNFKNRDYDRAIASIDQVFQAQPDHSGARFMRAVIAARHKEFLLAWYNVLIAKEKDAENAKIDKFIANLQQAMPRPTNFAAVPGVYRSIPTSLSEKLGDVIERLLQQQPSHNITNFTIGAPEAQGRGFIVPLALKFSSAGAKNELDAILKEATGRDITATNSADLTSIDYKLEFFDLPEMNPAVRPISGLVDFINVTAEEYDIAIRDTMERDLEGKVLETVYELAVRDFVSLNNFLRKVSPYTHFYRVLELRLSSVPGNSDVIWRGKVQVNYQLE